MKYIALVALYVGLTVYTLADVRDHRDRAPFGLPKVFWVILIFIVPFVGALAWIFMKFIRPEGARGSRRGPSAPDDDPEYLDWLERQERRRKRGES